MEHLSKCGSRCAKEFYGHNNFLPEISFCGALRVRFSRRQLEEECGPKTFGFQSKKNSTFQLPDNVDQIFDLHRKLCFMIDVERSKVCEECHSIFSYVNLLSLALKTNFSKFTKPHLSNCRQTVNGFSSNAADVVSGFPQCSVLGSTLIFSIH